MKDKTYYQEMLLHLVEPLKKHYSKDCASLQLGAFAAGYGNRIAGMEGFSRVLWGMVSYWAGGGKDESLLPVYQKGFCEGTNPASEEYWGDLHHKDQRMVEMTAISYGILMIPEKLWDPMGDAEKQCLADWLYQINLYTQADNNWQYFKVIANLALKSVGMKWNRDQVRDAMDRYESFYLGNGWYSDGKRPQKDYYTSFGIHFYCLLYAKFMEKEDPETAQRFKLRAAEFAKTFIYWFDDEGKALPFGRSLTYRFAQAAFFSACALAGVECFSLGIMKGMIQRHMEYWLRQPIFDNAGVLTVGYTYPNLLMSEAYNAPGSSYWALKTFVFLALPDDHPFWQAEYEVLPELKETYAVKECDMLLCHRKHEVVALTAGQYPVMEHPHAAEKYAKFAYSSVFGFCVPRSYHQLEQAGTDSMLAFYVQGMYYVRRTCMEYHVTGEEVYARWSPVEGIEVETWIIPVQNGHRRRHKITSNLNCMAYDCGFSYPNCMEETGKEEGNGFAAVFDKNGRSRISGNHGYGTVITALPNMNLVFPNVCIPAMEFTVKLGVTEIETLVETEFTDKEIVIGGGNCYALRD
ncbi:DUF2264 domain-containing protein [Lacrimispora sp.]|uniref:DUF2264 domain-containing protein n=1 Tax=Lacrimispora sp. TaxID=2719234 RepID=UPI0028A936F3|nr:DUF2264 domain-containing protein [Lacrimispora sp.]